MPEGTEAVIARIDERTEVIEREVKEIKGAARETNGRLKGLEIKDAARAGSLQMLGWMWIGLTALMTIGIGIAGVVLTVLIRTS